MIIPWELRTHFHTGISGGAEYAPVSAWQSFCTVMVVMTSFSGFFTGIRHFSRKSV